MRSKGFTVVSNERIRKSINETFTENFLQKLVSENPSKVKFVTDKKGKRAIKMLKS